MIYYIKRHSMIKIDGRANYALPILWRYQYRPSGLLRILWSRPETAASSKQEHAVPRTPGRFTSIARTLYKYATTSATTSATVACIAEASCSIHTVSIYTQYYTDRGSDCST